MASRHVAYVVETESAKIKSTAFCQIYVRQIFLLYSTMQT